MIQSKSCGFAAFDLEANKAGKKKAAPIMDRARPSLCHSGSHL